MSAASIPRRHGAAGEALGFACRWLLLAGAAGLIAAVAWQSLLAAVGVSQDVHGRFLVPDVLCKARLPKSRYCSQPGVLVGHTPAGKMPVVLAVRQAGQTAMAPAKSSQTFALYWLGCEVGLTKARFVGAPYGPLAFQETAAGVLGVEPGRRVALIDARLLPDEADAPAWADLLATCQQRGEAALFAVGSIKQYEEAVRRRARDAAAHTLPMLYRIEKPPYVLRRAAYDLRRPRRKDMIVVTGDAALADAAAGSGFTVHLVASGGSPSGQRRQGPATGTAVVPHADLRALGEFLRAEGR